ncbi:MAG: ribosome hibernation-promoting factor, HPF/YfiA family [Mycobacteriaceae bacterium]
MIDETVDASSLIRPVADVVVEGHNVVVPDHFRDYLADKLARLERFDDSLLQFEVKVQHERNRRQSKSSQHIELTAKGKGPTIRAEASADTFHAAADAALSKLESRLRRAQDRRKIHHGRHSPVSVAEATAAIAEQDEGQQITAEHEAAEREETEREAGPGRIVRTKEHTAEPMNVDEALFQMELVEHDFFLFQDSESGRPTVVYRRHGFDYGVIRLT